MRKLRCERRAHGDMEIVREYRELRGNRDRSNRTERESREMV